MSEWYPDVIDWQRDALNGHYPSSVFYGKAIRSQNHVVGFRDRSVFSKSWMLGNAAYSYAGTTPVARFRFRSRHGAQHLRMVLVILKSDPAGGSIDPTLDVQVTEVGVGTTTRTFSGFVDAPGSSDDRPSDWRIVIEQIDLTPNAAHTVLINLYDHARLGAVEIHEVGDPTISEATDYYVATVAQANTHIEDAWQQRLIEGSSNMYRHNGGTFCDFSTIDGGASTRTSATYINLIDNTTAGAPTAATPGWYLDMANRCTHHRPTTVPFELAVYGSIPGGSGTVKLVNSAGVTLATVTVNNATPQWFTATGLIATTAGKVDLQYAGDGVNALSVRAVSFNEWES